MLPQPVILNSKDVMNVVDGATIEPRIFKATRRRERKMQGFEIAGSSQRFLSVHATTNMRRAAIAVT